jgi:hypothetical protein
MDNCFLVTITRKGPVSLSYFWRALLRRCLSEPRRAGGGGSEIWKNFTKSEKSQKTAATQRWESTPLFGKK